MKNSSSDFGKGGRDGVGGAGGGTAGDGGGLNTGNGSSDSGDGGGYGTESGNDGSISSTGSGGGGGGRVVILDDTNGTNFFLSNVITGGRGGDSLDTNGSGGGGGTAVLAYKSGISLSFESGSATGGAGGNGGLNGGGGGGAAGVVLYRNGSVAVRNGVGITGGTGGNAGTDNQAGGGGGGAGVFLVGSSTPEMDGIGRDSGGGLTNDGTIAGGNGGNGLNGGKGGSGVLGNNADIINTGTITGGTGGQSRTNNSFNRGGAGGDGVHVFSGNGLNSSVTNTGIIKGGQGGGNTGASLVGQGGVGVRMTGSGGTLITSGAISGGKDGGASTGYAPAVHIEADDATLELRNGYAFGTNAASYADGVVSVTGTNATLALGGGEDATFNHADIGTIYTNFANLVKNGTSTWQVDGEVDKAWTIEEGVFKATGDITAILTNQTGAFLELAPDTGITATLSAAVTGGGAVEKKGAGTTVLGVADALATSSSFSVFEGTVRTTHDQRLTEYSSRDGSTLDMDNKTLTVSKGSVYGAITNANLVKNGADTLALYSADNTIATARIDAGTLELRNDAAIGATTVAANAILRAQKGTINGNLTIASDGTAEIHQATVTGNLDVASGGGVNIGVAGAASDELGRVTVTGSSTFADGARIGLTAAAVDLVNANDVTGSSILSSGGGINHQWQVDADGVFTILTGLGSVDFKLLNGEIFFVGFTSTPGSLGDGVADYWSNEGINVSGLVTDAFVQAAINATSDGTAAGDMQETTLDVLTGRNTTIVPTSREVRGAMASATGVNAAQTLDAVLGSTRNILATLRGRGGQIRRERQQIAGLTGSNAALASRIMNASTNNRIWAAGMGQWEDLDDSPGGIAGYTYRAGGAVVGYDRAFGPFTLGGAFAYLGGTFKDKSALANDSRIDNYSFDLYANYYHHSGFDFTVMGGYTYADSDIRRRLTRFADDGAGGVTAVRGWEEGDYGTDTWMAGFELGYEWRATECFSLRPSAGITYLNARSESYSRSFRADDGRPAASDRVDRVKNHSISLPLDLEAAYRTRVGSEATLGLTAHLGYAYELHNRGAEGTLAWGNVANAPRIDFRGRKPGRSSWNTGAGVAMAWRNLDVAVRYDYYHRNDFDAHVVVGSVGVSF